MVHYTRPITYCRLSSSLAIISLLLDRSSCPDDLLVRSHLNKNFLLTNLPLPMIDNFFHLPCVSSTTGRWQWCDRYVWVAAHCYLGYQPQAMLSCVYKWPGLCCGICRKSIQSSEQRSNVKKVFFLFQKRSRRGGKKKTCPLALEHQDCQNVGFA